MHRAFYSGYGKTWTAVERTWLDKSGTIKRHPKFLVITPTVQSEARKHLSCESIIGAEMNSVFHNGAWISDSGHWCPVVFALDILCSRVHDSTRPTSLTLAAIKDSGWYDVYMNLAEEVDIRLNSRSGCEVAEKSCFEMMAEGDNPESEGNVRMVGPVCVQETGVSLPLPY